MIPAFFRASSPWFCDVFFFWVQGRLPNSFNSEFKAGFFFEPAFFLQGLLQGGLQGEVRSKLQGKVLQGELQGELQGRLPTSSRRLPAVFCYFGRRDPEACLEAFLELSVTPS